MNEWSIKLHKNFKKQLAKLPKMHRDKVVDTIELFLESPADPSLRMHALIAEWTGYSSISAGGDLRLHFKIVQGNVVYCVAVGTHSQLYK